MEVELGSAVMEAREGVMIEVMRTLRPSSWLLVLLLQ